MDYHYKEPRRLRITRKDLTDEDIEKAQKVLKKDIEQQRPDIEQEYNN